MAEIGFALTEQQMRELKFLVGWGYGTSPAEVARFLLERELDDLRRSGVIPPYCDCGKPK